MKLWCQISYYDISETESDTVMAAFTDFGRKTLPQNFSTVVVILSGVLHKTETVNVAHVRLAVRPQEIESAHRLLKDNRREM